MYTIIPEDNSSQNGVEDNNKRSSSEYPNNFQSNNDNTSTLSCSSNSKNEIMPFSKELGKEEEKDRKTLIESPLSKNINSLSKNEVTNKNDYEEMKEINGSYSNLQQPLICKFCFVFNLILYYFFYSSCSGSRSSTYNK